MIEGQLKSTVPPAVEPVTVAEAKQHLVGFNDADALLIGDLIKRARAMVESDTGLAMIEQTYEYALPCWSRDLNQNYVVDLPRPPLRSVDSIQYYDAEGALQTLASTEYRTADHGLRARITEAYGKTWPAVEYNRPDAIVVTFTAGVYTETDGVIDPNSATHMAARYEIAKQAILVMVDHLYRNRGVVAPVQLSTIPHSYTAQVQSARVAWI